MQIDFEKDKEVPPEIAGWNWGAFVLTWIWGICNGTLISLLSLIPGVHFVMMFVLGMKGNEWAWRNKDWDSVEHFQRTQRKWAAAGIGLFIAGALALIVIPFGILAFGISFEWPQMQRMVSEFESHRRFCNYAICQAERHPRVLSYLGAPLRPVGPAQYVSREPGYSELAVPVRGPRGEGVLYLRTHKKDNAEIELERAEFQLKGLERLELRARVPRSEIMAAENRVANLVAAVRRENNWHKREPSGELEAEEFYLASLQRLEADSRVSDLLGKPINAALEYAKVNVEGPSGEAEFKAVLNGAGKTAVLQMSGKRSLGQWKLMHARMEADGQETDLLRN